MKTRDAAAASLLIVIAALHAWLAVAAMSGKSTTADEIAHITAGYAFDRLGDFRLQPENGVLPQRWQALALGAPTFPSMDSDAWKKGDVWRVGHEFFYDCGNDVALLLSAARAMSSIFGVATLLLSGRWAWRLFGRAGAVVAVLFAALSPTMLAHTGLATSDMCSAFFLLASVTVFWWHLHDGRMVVALVSAVVFGLACVAKYSAPLLLPMFATLALVRSIESEPLHWARWTFRSRASRLAAIAASFALHGIGAVAIIWAFFGFRYSAFDPGLPAGTFYLSWSEVTTYGGTTARLLDWFRTAHLLPEAYLYGLAFVVEHSLARSAFLDGAYSNSGWLQFFPKAFVYKTSPAVIAAVLAALLITVAWARTVRPSRVRERMLTAAPLAALFIVYWIFSLTGHLNIGHRHILPTYPVLTIFIGALGWGVTRMPSPTRIARPVLAAMLGLLCVWQGGIAARAYPSYLAYFSPIAGGSKHGYLHLVDSSLDWGQDLPGLAKWLRAHRKPGEPVFLSYFGLGDPGYYGIEARRLPFVPEFDVCHKPEKLEPGLYAVSASMLQQVFLEFRGPWTAEWERRYQSLRAREHELTGDARMTPEAGEDGKLATTYDQLRFARLCQYLRNREPDDEVGYSILIYRVSQQELEVALDGSLNDLARAVRALSRQP